VKLTTWCARCREYRNNGDASRAPQVLSTSCSYAVELEPLCGTRPTCGPTSVTASSPGAAVAHLLECPDRLLSGTPIGRMVGPSHEVRRLAAAEREYAKQFGIEPPDGVSERRTNQS